MIAESQLNPNFMIDKSDTVRESEMWSRGKKNVAFIDKIARDSFSNTIWKLK